MPRRVKGPDGKVHTFPDDATDAEIAEAFGATTEQPTPEAAPKPPGWRDLGLQALDVAPTVGAIGGAALGSGLASIPLAAGGAGIGATVRQVGRKMLGEETPSLKDAGTEIAESAVLQGAGQAAGLGARKALPFMARRLYQAHAKPSVRLRQEFPTLVEDAVENRVPIGDKGVVRAEKLVGESSDKADAMVAGASGTVGRGDILQHVPAEAVGDAVDMLQGGGLGARMANMQGTLQRIGSGQPLTVQETQAVKRFLQGQGEQYYKAAAADASLQSGAKSELAAKMAQGAREGVERHVPAVGPQNAQTQRLIGVRRMAEAGTERVKNNLPTGLGMQTLISTGIGGAVGAGSGDSTKGTMAGMLALALTNPALATRLAIGINRVAPAAAHTPQAARAAYLIQALTEGGE